MNIYNENNVEVLERLKLSFMIGNRKLPGTLTSTGMCLTTG